MDKNIIREQGAVNSDEFDDLILIERAIKVLKNGGLLNDEDLEVIAEFTGDQSTYALTTTHQRKGLRKRFISICERIAFYLGGSFTDDGYLNYMKRKHRLTDTQINKLKEYISSAYKHKIIRKPK
jgi:hypothetical protein